MRKSLLLLLCLLLLCGCAAAPAEAPSTAVQTETQQTVPTIQPPETTEADAGLSGVTLTVPERLTLTADAPETTLYVRFSGVDPAGAPEGRRCELTLLRDGEAVWSEEDFLLKEGALAAVPVSFPFTRYLRRTQALYAVRLRYKDQSLIEYVPVTLNNWSDEVYAYMTDDPMPYELWVLKEQNAVIVYGKDETGEYTQPAKVFACSTGNYTPVGTYRMGPRYEWRALFGGVFGQYACQITKNILFHSVPYTRLTKDSLKPGEYNKLGTTASMGCVRLCVRDAKWIYDYCPDGTTVRIFSAGTTPMDPPEPIRIDPDSPDAGWDPTDPDPENPWTHHD